jgi:predicted nucleic acid-binding protein
MRIFLDANILVALLNKEYPVFSYAARIVSLAENEKVKIFTSPICLAIAFYFAEKKVGSKHALQKMHILSHKLEIASTGENEVLQTASNKKINDFEDGLEYYSALNKKCNYIITEDTDDYYFSEIKVFTAKAFFDEVMSVKKLN